MKKYLIFALALFAVFFYTASIKAQEKTAISPEKEKLIAELIVLTKSDQQIREITDTMLSSMDTYLVKMVDDLSATTEGLAGEEKERITGELKKRVLSFNEKFRKRLPEVVDYSQFIKDTMYPLYDKFYTEKDLIDLVNFYKTPIGQKMVNSTPQLVKESLELTEKLLLPKVEKLAEEILEEEFKNIEEVLLSSPPAPKDGTR